MRILSSYLFATPAYRYKDEILQGWVKTTTHPRGRVARVEWSIDSLDNYEEISDRIRDADNTELKAYWLSALHNIRWANNRWGMAHVDLKKLADYETTFLRLWTELINNALKGITQ